MIDQVIDRKGFALPMSIFVVAFLTISLTAAFAAISSERRIVDNTAAQFEVLMAAQTGLEAFVGSRDSFGFLASPPAVYESTRVNVAGGYADVVLQRLRPSVNGSRSVYVIRSRGVLTDPALPGTSQAERIVAQFARWEPGSINVRAGWTSLTGLHKNGTAGSISGVDRCGGEPTVAGVAVADPPGFTKSGNFNPTGLPPVENLGTASQAADSLSIDWAGLESKSAITPDIEIPGDAWPSFGNSNYWPIIHVTGDFTLPSTGRGILIVTGSLTISGNKTFEGIVLVGERLTSNGNNKVYGATFTGLDVLTAPNPDSAATAIGQNAVGNGNKTYQYDSCSVAAALGAIGGLQVLSNGWLDNWPAW